MYVTTITTIVFKVSFENVDLLQYNDIIHVCACARIRMCMRLCARALVRMCACMRDCVCVFVAAEINSIWEWCHLDLYHC